MFYTLLCLCIIALALWVWHEILHRKEITKTSGAIINGLHTMLQNNDAAWEKGQEDLVEMYEMTLLTLREKYTKLDLEYNAYKADIAKVADDIERDLALWETPDDPIKNTPSDGDIHG